MASGNISSHRPIIQSVVTLSNVATSATTINTYNGRKFSDYDLLIFVAESTGNDYRSTGIITSSMWSSSKSIFCTSAHGASLENTSGIAVYYGSDTSCTAVATGNAAYTKLEVIGLRFV